MGMIYALESFVFRAFTHGAEGKASKKSPVGIDTSAMNKMMKNFDKC
jgi:FAD/FMN-containing dehydrogenase